MKQSILWVIGIVEGYFEKAGDSGEVLVGSIAEEGFGRFVEDGSSELRAVYKYDRGYVMEALVVMNAVAAVFVKC